MTISLVNATLDKTDPPELDIVDVDSVWSEAEPLLARALEDSDDTTDDIYQLCKLGGAQMLASTDAFAVVQMVSAPRHKFDLLVWAAASRGGKNCIKTHLAEIERIAFNMGARYVAFQSGRKGFYKVLPDDWAPKQVTFAKRLH